MKSAFFKCLSFWLLATVPIRPDKVQLKNGNELEGRILREDDREVVLRMGGGTITLLRSAVRSVAREDEQVNARREESWNRQNVLHPAAVPTGWLDVATGLQTLTERRHGAVRAWRDLRSMEEERRRLKAEFERGREELAAVSREVSAARPETADAAAVKVYNEKVLRQNDLFSGNLQRQLAIEALDARLGKAGAEVSEYQVRLGAFRALLDSRRSDLPVEGASGNLKTFLEGVGERMAALEKDCISYSIPTEGESGGRRVSVSINGRPAGSFVVDTGASTMILNADLAARLGIPVDPGRVARFRVADGREVECPVVWLESVQVGDARAERVLAGVMPAGERGAVRVEGLLGMTFLRNFIVELDGRTGQLVLRKFEPR